MNFICAGKERKQAARQAWRQVVLTIEKGKITIYDLKCPLHIRRLTTLTQFVENANISQIRIKY